MKSSAQSDYERTESAYERARNEVAALENETQANSLSGFALLDIEARTAALEERLGASAGPASSERYQGLRERITALRTRIDKQRAAKPQCEEAWEQWRREQEDAKRNWENSPSGQDWMAERAQRTAAAAEKDAMRAPCLAILQRPDPKAVAEGLRHQAGFWMRTAMLIASRKGKGKSVEELLAIVLELRARKIPPAQQYDAARVLLGLSPTSPEAPRAEQGRAEVETAPKIEARTPAMVFLLGLARAPLMVLRLHPAGAILALLTATVGSRYSATAVTLLLAKAAEWAAKFS